MCARACVSVHTHVQGCVLHVCRCFWSPEEGIDTLGLEVPVVASCPSDRNQNPGPWEEQQEFLTAESSFQPRVHAFSRLHRISGMNTRSSTNILLLLGNRIEDTQANPTCSPWAEWTGGALSVAHSRGVKSLKTS